MIFSQKTTYGIQTTLFLVMDREEEKIGTRHISSETGISYSYLTKIVKKLNDGGIINTERGKGGGLTLAKPPEEIRLLDIVYILEGKDYFDTCILGNEQQSGLNLNTWDTIQNNIKTFLATSTLEDLATNKQNKHIRLSKKLIYSV